jgi:hypothetical protein
VTQASQSKLHRFESAGALVGAGLALMPGLFLGVVVGGNFGGALVAAASESVFGNAGPGVLVGVVIGILVVGGAFVWTAAFAGRLVGRVICRVRRSEV